MMEVIASIVGALVGAILVATYSYMLQEKLRRANEDFQKKLWEDQKAFQELLLKRQMRHNEEMAREERNFRTTGIASMRKIGGGG
jgi:hypothetical protein